MANFTQQKRFDLVNDWKVNSNKVKRNEPNYTNGMHSKL